jgi:hypothetical protein
MQWTSAEVSSPGKAPNQGRPRPTSKLAPCAIHLRPRVGARRARPARQRDARWLEQHVDLGDELVVAGIVVAEL